jgi:hypothetical protein
VSIDCAVGISCAPKFTDSNFFTQGYRLNIYRAVKLLIIVTRFVMLFWVLSAQENAHDPYLCPFRQTRFCNVAGFRNIHFGVNHNYQKRIGGQEKFPVRQWIL